MGAAVARWPLLQSCNPETAFSKRESSEKQLPYFSLKFAHCSNPRRNGAAERLQTTPFKFMLTFFCFVQLFLHQK